MKEVQLKTLAVENGESVFDVSNIDEIRFNHKSRSITGFVNDSKKYKLEDIDQMSWQAIKKLVVGNKGEWSNKKAGIDFLTALEA